MKDSQTLTVRLESPPEACKPEEHASYRRNLSLFRMSAAWPSRRGEINHLRWADVDLEGGRIHLRAREDKERGYSFQPKWGIERTIPIMGDASGVLLRRAEKRIAPGDPMETVFYSPKSTTKKRPNGPSIPLSPRNVTRLTTRYHRKAGLPEGLSFHSFRHSFATWLLSDGVPVAKVQRWLGHQSIEQTMVYARFLPESVTGEDVTTFDSIGEHTPALGAILQIGGARRD